MPRYDSCNDCGEQVQRSSTSAATIRCRPCRAKNRCGLAAGYSAGCRCQRCKDAKAAEMRAYAKRRKEQGRPLPKSKWRAYEELTCDCCMKTFTREKRNERRYKRTYCSGLCRDYDRWGPLSKPLPKDHWVYMYGATCQWAPPKPTGPFPFECAWCETKGISDYPTTEYCDDNCKKRARRARRRGRAAGAHGTYTWGQVVRLWGGFNKQCAYCRTPTPLENIQAEHVTALARGGANNIGNILPSCAPCNSDKRDLSMNEWKADRARRGLEPVITHWDRHDDRYAHLAPMGHDLAA